MRSKSREPLPVFMGLYNAMATVKTHTNAFPNVVLMTGATGLVGTAMVQRIAHGHPATTVRILSRSGDQVNHIGGVPVEGWSWDPQAGTVPPAVVDGVECIVHLAGETVAQRWSPSIKRRIRASRIDSLGLLQEACKRRGVAPRIVSASAVGWYPSSAEIQRESQPLGTGFVAEVVGDWEAAAAGLGELGGGHVSLRIGLVLSKQGGVIAKLAPLYNWGLGSPLSPGTQWQSWIHIQDLVRLFLCAMGRPDWSGAFNAVSPTPVQQKWFSASIAEALSRPHFLPPVPRMAIRLMYGEAADALLASHRIIPERVLHEGFQFDHVELDAALRDVFG